MKKIYTKLAVISLSIIGQMAFADTLSLKTQNDNQFGISLSSYKYEEPDFMRSGYIFMQLKGNKLGFDGENTRLLHNGNFIRLEYRSQFGEVDYSSPESGNEPSLDDILFEGRLLYGLDKDLNYGVIAPYIGLGYRYLYNDGRGMSSLGSFGYRRESRYLYSPVGFRYRTILNNHLTTWNAEYGYLIRGKQKSYLSDVNYWEGDINNDQHSGNHLHFAMTSAIGKWEIGPFFDYWNIARSNVYSNGIVAGVEPRNNTKDFGIRFSRHFD